MLLLTVTGVVGVLAAARARDVIRTAHPQRLSVDVPPAHAPSTGLLLRITPFGVALAA